MAIISNIFFERALQQAARILGRKPRLLLLVGKLGLKLKSVKWSEIKSIEVKEKFFVTGRLLKAYALGQYRTIPWKAVLLITGATLYFLMPLDLIPDVIAGIGLTDDVGILIAVYQSLGHEIEKFLSWEKARTIQP